MRRASAITISIFLMMVMLAVLLGYTAFYVDQVMVKPIVQMRDSEVRLKCFFLLSNMIGGEYLREGEEPPTGSLRSELLDTYDISLGGQDLYLGNYSDIYDYVLESTYKDASVVVRNNEVFWTTVRNNDLPVACYLRVYGPVRPGVAGLFTQSGVEELMDDV